jgi:cytochrome c-type biogenesis protein
VSDILVGTTLLVSFLGGVVALLAPCCVSVMLPAYLATGFRARGGVLVATLVFGTGVATVILPIGLGATALSRLLVDQHQWIFSIGGLLVIAAGMAALAGRTPPLPMPGIRGGRGGLGSAYALGVFSGAASACCAPVLVGVAVLAGAAGSFPVALSIGLVYVAGMVAPLAILAALWDRLGNRAAALLSERRVNVGLRTEVPLGSALAGVLMIAMGVLALVLAVTGPGMPSEGWQTRLSGWLQHVAAAATNALSFVPGWAAGLVLLAGFGLAILSVVRGKSVAAWKDLDDNPKQIDAGAE